MHRRLAAAVLAALALTVSVAPPVRADASVLRDPRGDAPARFDLTRIEVANAADAITVRVRVRDLQGRGTQIFGFAVRPTTGDSVHMVSTVRRAGGRTTARVTTVEAGELVVVPCPVSSEWRPRRDLIVVAFPRDCVPDPGSLRFNFYIGAGDGSAGDPVDWTRSVRVAQG